MLTGRPYMITFNTSLCKISEIAVLVLFIYLCYKINSDIYFRTQTN